MILIVSAGSNNKYLFLNNVDTFIPHSFSPYDYKTAIMQQPTTTIVYCYSLFGNIIVHKRVISCS